MASPIQVGILGLGRSGHDIHARAIGGMPGLFHVAVVYDPWEQRLADAASSLRARAALSAEALWSDPAVELVIVASPNRFHFEQALAALEAGKHVICEKPFGTTVAMVDELIAAAEAKGLILQPFQQRRYEGDFLEVKRIVDSGLLGTVQLIRTCWHSFKRRWDWQTLPEFQGGELYNNGPHPIDHAMLLMGDTDETPLEMPELKVWCERRRGLTSGKAEDHVKIILSAPGRPTTEIELSSTIAFGQERWLVAGTAGGLRGHANGLEYKWVDWSTMPERVADAHPTRDRSYNSEAIAWKTATWKPEAQADAGGGAAPASMPIVSLYRDLYKTVREGAKQVITPGSVRRRIAVVEACAAAPVIDSGR